MTKLPTLTCIALALFAAGAHAADAPADCSDKTDIKSKSRTSNKLQTLMVSLLTLEKQGEADFKPAYAAPTSECTWEHFAAGGTNVTAIHAATVTDQQSLAWRFDTDGAESREIIVMFDLNASLVAEKPTYFVIENRKGDISYYEMYREPPAYSALKPLVSGILDGSAKPFATVRWPKGAKEPEIDAVDMKRLK
jgi:hypothetical protein